jgi:hypothetical protein
VCGLSASIYGFSAMTALRARPYSGRMFRRTAECLHTDVASHGTEPGDPLSGKAMLPGDHEYGWCRACAQYVQRELDSVVWIIRPGYARGVWMWRVDDTAEADAERAEQMSRARATPA